MPINKITFNRRIRIKVFLVLICLLFSFFCVFTGIRAVQLKKYDTASPLTLREKQELAFLLKGLYPQQYETLKPLPYDISFPGLDVYAESAILIDVANGNILYQKNADEIIPPASMTKLFAMYVVDEEVSAGNFSYDAVIPLPPECWACNMPPHSSLMFLGEGQHVTLEELLLGLSICSGNDAAYAIAYALFGSMDAFVLKMNEVAEELGLMHTHFVESSGYSEKNTTTPREMAEFCCIYLRQHPQSLQKFHSVQSFTYPKEHNLAKGDFISAQDFSNGIPSRITMPVTQRNTNPLLGVLDGVDGLKTGYIDESGYNLSLTAKRNGTRYLSITMKGPGATTAEGQNGRIHDGTLLMNWAFSKFADYNISHVVHPYFVKRFGADQMGMNIVPAYTPEVLTVPFVLGNSLEENLVNVKYRIIIDENKWGKIEKGTICGKIIISLGDYTLQEIPLVADRKLHKASFLVALADKVIFFFAKIIV